MFILAETATKKQKPQITGTRWSGGFDILKIQVLEKGVFDAPAEACAGGDADVHVGLDAGDSVVGPEDGAGSRLVAADADGGAAIQDGGAAIPDAIAIACGAVGHAETVASGGLHSVVAEVTDEGFFAGGHRAGEDERGSLHFNFRH